MNFLERMKGDPTRLRWRGTFTGSVVLTAEVPRDILGVQVMQIANAAPGTDYFTIDYATDRPKRDQFTLYSWLNNAASVAASEVEVIVFIN